MGHRSNDSKTAVVVVVVDRLRAVVCIINDVPHTIEHVASVLRAYTGPIIPLMFHAIG